MRVGGAGTLEHFSEVALQAKVRAVLAASVFHFRTLRIGEVKEHLESRGIPVLRRGQRKVRIASVIAFPRR